MVVARQPGAFRSLVAQLAQRTVERRYLALVRGSLTEERGMVDAAIGRSPRMRTRMAVTADGRCARTAFSVMRRFDLPTPTTLLTVSLETGRTHQIRVHLAAIGHPVVGDDRYGGDRGSRRGGSASASWSHLSPGRQFLHAFELSFDHPRTGERVRFEAPLPADLATALPDVPGDR